MIPTSPHAAAGSRTEPPVSVPSAIGTIPLATAAPDPEDEPPQIYSGCHGLVGVPEYELCPVVPSPNSTDVKRPQSIAPCLSNLSMTKAVWEAW